MLLYDVFYYTCDGHFILAVCNFDVAWGAIVPPPPGWVARATCTTGERTETWIDDRKAVIPRPVWAT